MKHLKDIVVAIAQVGLDNYLKPPVAKIDVFRHFFSNGVLDDSRLDERDGGCTRRELLLRMLLLNAVLDQGPDIEGVREMMVETVNHLYQNEVRIFHRPLDLFKEINVSVEEIWKRHEQVKSRRAAQWAQINQTSATKYNLYMDGSKQTLNYAIFRWGVPLALSYLLSQNQGGEQATALVDYLETYSSAEQMSDQLKEHHKFGLGKAIGNKACHLFAKWMVSTFGLARKKNDTGWSEYSYEVPFDSNAGRVLWRTGYLSSLASEDEYKKNEVIQINKGKKGTHYIRVTNMRGMRVSADIPTDLVDVYKGICVNHLKSHKIEPRKVEIQRFQHALLWQSKEENLTVSAFDDGLIEIGRNYCLNHEQPRCESCPINQHCKGYQSNNALITEYRT